MCLSDALVSLMLQAGILYCGHLWPRPAPEAGHNSPLYRFVLPHNTPHTLGSIRKLTLLHTSTVPSLIRCREVMDQLGPIEQPQE
jgi:hypothetical protein